MWDFARHFFGLLSVLVLVGFVTAVSGQSTTPPETATAPQAGNSDHYDPDDLKTYPDVTSEDRTIQVRGRELTVHFYRRNTGSTDLAIYACGDGGWRGLAPRTAEELAHRGFVVAGLDSKVYLRDFSSVVEPLTIRQLSSDYVEVANSLRSYAGQPPNTRVYLYGWSLGAGFAVAVGSDVQQRQNWAGIISIGLPKQNQLVSGVGGNHVNLHSESKETFGFRTEALIASISPLPLAMIQSTSDTASPPSVGRVLYSTARDPKKLIVLKASNHRFSGAREEFYSSLTDVVPWMRDSVKVMSDESATFKDNH